MAQQWNTASFKQAVLAAAGPVLVDFHAEWCGPCKAQGPIIEGLSSEYAGRAAVGTVDVDANPELAQLLKVRSIPTLLLFRGGRVAQRFTGLTTADRLRAAIDTALA